MSPHKYWRRTATSVGVVVVGGVINKVLFAGSAVMGRRYARRGWRKSAGCYLPLPLLMGCACKWAFPDWPVSKCLPMSAERSRSLSHFALGSTQTALSSLLPHIPCIFPVLLPLSDSSLGNLCYQVLSMAMKMWVDWWGAGVGWWWWWWWGGRGVHQSSLSCCWSREKSCKWLAVSWGSWPEAKDPHEGLNDHFWVGVLYTMWILFLALCT